MADRFYRARWHAAFLVGEYVIAPFLLAAIYGLRWCARQAVREER